MVLSPESQGIGVYFQSSKNYRILKIITAEYAEFHGVLAVNPVFFCFLCVTPGNRRFRPSVVNFLQNSANLTVFAR
jgi:hypothetical protein